MYRGFNIYMGFPDDAWNYIQGQNVISEQEKVVNDEISKFLSPRGSIQGDKLQTNWFPQIEADVFISHSHEDTDTAIRLAGWLYHHFNIISFIDSTIWGYCDSLLKKLDDAYCLNPGGQTYSYESRNKSTAHVHVMLSAALTQMMDNTECLFFLNTPKSISTTDVINNPQTNSPWLYYEICMSRIIPKALDKHRNRKYLSKSRTFTELNEHEKFPEITYPTYTGHLTTIDGNNLVEWRNQYNKILPTPEHGLDLLYQQY